MAKFTATIKGMHCASCAANIERSLKTVKGVKDVTVNVMAHKGFIESEESVSEKDITDAVKRAGYTVVTLSKT